MLNSSDVTVVADSLGQTTTFRQVLGDSIVCLSRDATLGWTTEQCNTTILKAIVQGQTATVTCSCNGTAPTTIVNDIQSLFARKQTTAATAGFPFSKQYVFYILWFKIAFFVMFAYIGNSQDK